MSPEPTTSDRDTELRRMLVATASAAPTRSRRRWSVAGPIIAFAVAGAFTGAVSAAALTAPAPDRSVNVEAMTSTLVYDDTQLFGPPALVSGQGSTTVQLGAMPEGATELVVAFRCDDAGRFDFLLDGVNVGASICDEASTSSASGGSFFTVENADSHTFTVTTDEQSRYVLWASWAARALPPAAREAQTDAMADGQVTNEEYRAAFTRYSECMTAAGYPLLGVNDAGTVITYSNSDAAVTSGVEGKCYALEFGQIDPAWQIANEYESDTQVTLRACLQAEGITPGPDVETVWQQIQDAGIDPVECTTGTKSPFNE